MNTHGFFQDKYHRLHVFLAVIIASILNGALNWLFDVPIKSPLFLDSSFTIAVGIYFGPIPGMITGLLTNLFMASLRSFDSANISFSIVNMATGLCAGLMARNKKKFWMLPQQLSLILVLTLVNSFLGALVATFVFGGITGTLPDIPVKALILLGRGIFSSVFLARIILNIVDKGIAVTLIYIGYRIFQIRRKDEDTKAFI